VRSKAFVLCRIYALIAGSDEVRRREHDGDSRAGLTGTKNRAKEWPVDGG
jgi:hypothetical protein